MNKVSLFLSLFLTLNLLAQSTPEWMRYAEISPDGSKIAFSYKSNLYYVENNKSLAIPISIDDSYEYEAVWSPDSKHVAFASDRYGNFDVFVYNTEIGETKRLSYHSANDIPQSFTADGKAVLFTSGRKMNAQNSQFPYGRFSQLYSVSLDANRPKLEIPLPLDAVDVKKDGSQWLYMDIKGYEDYWRKHHTSSIARDVWIYNASDKTHEQLTNFQGEDRNPIWANDQESIYYLSERSGTFNVWKVKSGDNNSPIQISNFDTHPVRFLSLSDNGTLCYTYHGEIYIQTEGEEPVRKSINIPYEQGSVEKLKTFNSDASEMALSPNGKEIAFIIRGEIFVTGIETGLTKRITNTPEQERSVHFHPEGKKLVYASERNGSWNLYETSISADDEPYFYAATLLEEKTVLANENETFQPKYSPDGKEVAYLSNRTTLKVLNFDSGNTRTVLPGNKNYSYSDGDQYYAWSPDNKWFTVDFIDKNRWVKEIGLVKADGSEPVKNITESGYTESGGKWINDGQAIVFYSDKQGFRSHGSWGSTGDAFAVYLNMEAYQKAQMTKDEYKLWKEQQEKKDEDEESEDKKEKKSKGEKPVKIEFENLKDRMKRLTISSSFISDMQVSPDGETLYYISSRDNSYDLWEMDIREKKTKTIGNFKGGDASLAMDEDGKNLFVMVGGRFYKVETKSGTSKPVSFKAEMYLDAQAERAYLFEHMWRQVLRKFYKENLHGVEWDNLKTAYQQKLKHINNNRDFAEMMSELLGELNGSHTGCRYYHTDSEGTSTASLGIYTDETYTDSGIKIAEVIEKSPLAIADEGIKPGMIITKINDKTIASGENYYPFLNHKAGKDVVLEVTDANGQNPKKIKIEGLSMSEDLNLRYERWVKSRREVTEKLSEGRLGYVHVRGMNSSSFREVFEDLLGRYNDKKAVVVDTRFNGGGWLHDDLATLLSGEMYVKLMPRGQYIGSEPQNKWQKPSAVIVGEGNYSDAHFFPYTYRALDIGKIIGMPVPGTSTAVWWERQINPNIVFGIPQVGITNMKGEYLENKQLEPDVKVKNQPGELVKGTDRQLEKAIEVLLNDLD